MARRALWAFAVGLLALLQGCDPTPSSTPYVARVYDSYLTQAEVTKALDQLAPGLDSTEARTQIIEQWVRGQLLYREALDRGLDRTPSVVDQLETSEQTILRSAALELLSSEAEVEPSRAAVTQYYEEYAEQLRLREPYVRVYYVSSTDETALREAHVTLGRLTDTDSLDLAFPSLVDLPGAQPEVAVSLSRRYVPSSVIFAGAVSERNTLRGLRTEELSPVITTPSHAYFIYLAARKGEGEIPELPLIEAEIKQRISIQARKVRVERELQRLRNEAIAREALEIK